MASTGTLCGGLVCIRPYSELLHAGGHVRGVVVRPPGPYTPPLVGLT